MLINFFEGVCKTDSNKTKFGICDDPPLPPVPNAPAYIDEPNSHKWIGVVNNPTEKKVDFYAIDNCIIILKADGVNNESRCDGLLHFDKSIIFVELKMRGAGGWLSKARSQLTITIDKFKENNNLSDFDQIEAYACNGLRPYANQGNNSELQKFKDDTGLIMHAQQEINI